MAEYIDKQDVAPVVHGFWKPVGTSKPFYVCSVCKCRNLFNNGHIELSNYCPNCGAKMDMEESQ